MAPTLELELESLHELESEGEGEFELHELHELESELELEGEGELEMEMELEGEGELEMEMEMEISPVRKIYADAMMEHLAHVAAECETEQEAAEQFLPLIGMAAKKLLPVVAKAVAPAAKKVLPRIAKAVTRVEPRLTRGITTIARNLYRQPGTRRLLHAVPAIARRTISSIAGQVAHGRPITARGAIRTLARQTRRVLGQPHHRRHALRRSAILDRRFHRHFGPGVVRPHWRGRPWQGWYGGYGAPGYYPGHPAAPGVPPHAGPGPVPRPPAPGPGPAPSHGGCPSCGRQPSVCGCCGQIIR